MKRTFFIPILAAFLACLSPGARAQELVANGNMETDAKGAGTPDGWGRAKTGGSYEEENGNHFLRLRADQPEQLNMFYREVKLPPEVRAVELKFRGRLSDFKVGSLPWYDARIMMNFVDDNRKKVTPGPKVPAFNKNTGGWVEKDIKFLVPEGAKMLQMMPSLFRVKTGTFDFDDVSVTPTDPAVLIEEAAAAAAADKAADVPLEAPDKAKWPKTLHVEGKKVLDSDGKEIWLQGVNAGGLETLPQDKHVMKSALVAVEDWKANIVRLPMNETFWFGRSPYQKDGGAAYRKYIDDIVTLVANRGAYLLLDLHRFRAPTQEHVDFWKDAAAHYKDHPAVLFDLFNEPHSMSWEIWKNGGLIVEKKKGVDESAFLTPEEKAKSNAGFQTVGMQALIDTVRATGAKNIVVPGGLAWSGDLSGIVNGYALEDKGGNGIIYNWHQYNWHKNWQHVVGDTAEKYPILVGEVGADIHKMDFIPKSDQEDPYTWVPDMLGFIQKNHLHWTAWCLHPKATPVLISDWKYTPTPYWGVFAKRALAGEKFEMKRMR